MEESHSDSREWPSRRTFVKYVAGSLAAHSALGSLACTTNQNQNGVPQATPPAAAAASPTPAAGPQKSDCCPPGGGGIESDLPPVIVGGYESVRVEIENPLRPESMGGSPPFVYTHHGDTPPEKRYGNLLEVRVITERANRPYVTDVRYFGLPDGAQLFVWYQPINPTPSGADCTFPTVAFPDNDPDMRVKGGTGAEPFRLTLKHRRFENEASPVQTHKCARPHRYKHRNIPNPSGGGNLRHFRIGRWRLVNSAGAMISDFQGFGDEDYTLYLLFDHVA